MKRVYKSIGLMAGTSLDGDVDVALIETDGQAHVKPLDFFEYHVPDYHRDMIAACFGKRERDKDTQAAEDYVTHIHIDAVKASGFDADVIGFHGQTITHAPEDSFTWQLGDGAAMAVELGIDVVNDFRSADIKAGGQGAPLAPLYHQAISAAAEKPLAILNLGGVGNVTYSSQSRHPGEGPDLQDMQNKIPAFAGKTADILAFDTGPANALMDDYCAKHFGNAFDENGRIAESGKADRAVIDQFLSDPYFKMDPPKSLDRDHFQSLISALPDDPKDALATLAVCSAVSVMASVKHFPHPPLTWYVCGGGRKNAFLMQLLEDMLRPSQIVAIEETGYDGDAIEAQAFAYLAVRSIIGLPISLPTTTGVAQPLTGGVWHKA